MRALRSRLGLGLAPVAIAAGLGFWNLGFGLPFGFRPDEDVMVGRAVRMAAEGSLDPLFANYPPLVFYIFAGAERLTGHLAGAAGPDPTVAYLSARSVSAAAFTMAVALTWLAGRRAYGAAAGLAAATALALAPLAVRQAHFATTDMVQTAFVAAALAAAATAAGRGRGLAGAGALCGLAAAAKYTGGLALVFVVVVALQTQGRRAAAMAVGAAAAAFALPSAVFLLHPSEYLAGLLFLGGNAYAKHRDLPLGIVFHTTVSLPFGLGLGTCAVAAGGALLAAVRRSPVDLGLLAFTAAYLALTGLGHEDFFRYMLPLLPALCLLAGGLVGLAPRPALGPALAAFGLLLLPAASVSLGTDRLLGREDTRAQAARWLDAHAAPGSALASPYYGGPFYDAAEVAANRRYVDDPLAAGFLQGRFTTRFRINGPGPGFRLLASGPPAQAPVPSAGEAPAASFSAGRPGGVYDPLDSFYLPIWNLDRVSRPGPSITIVREP